jgi:type IX secretion system PorP/SprF family membrane protein
MAMRKIIRYKIIIACLLVTTSAINSYAQEDPTNKQYLFNLLNINPAYAGVRGNLSMTASFRQQWSGVPGAPKTGIFSIDAPVGTHHLGLGLQVYNGTLGLEKTTGLNASFATKLQFTEEEFMSLGIQAGIMNYRIDRTSTALPYQNDPAFQNNMNVFMPTAGIGIYYQRNSWYASLSAPSLLMSTVKVDKIISINSATIKNIQLLFTTGVSVDMGESFQFRPSVFFRYVSGNVFESHINSSVWVMNLLGFGVSYRPDDAILGILELRVKDKLSFGYSYGKSIGDKVAFNQPSHEAFLRFDLSSKDE